MGLLDECDTHVRDELSAFRRRQEESRNDIGRRTSAASRWRVNRGPIGRAIGGPIVAGQQPLTLPLDGQLAVSGP